MTNNTPSGAKMHRECTEPESRQTAKVFFFLSSSSSSSSDGLVQICVTLSRWFSHKTAAVLFPDRKTFSPEKACQCEGQKCLNEFSNYLSRSSIKSSTLFLQTAWTVSTLIHIAAGHLANLADNSLDKVECTAHQLGSGGVAGIMSVIMHLLSVKGLAGATFHQNRVC